MTSRQVLSFVLTLLGLAVSTIPSFANVYLVGGQTQRSTDGGTTWGSPDGTGLEGVSLVPGTPNTVVGVGVLGRIRRSTNGGSTWTTITSPSGNSLHDVSFSGNTGYIAGNSVLLKSVDGGATWTVLAPASPPPTRDWTSVSFSSPTNGVIGSDGGDLFHTSDGGAHWTDAGQSTGGLNDIQLLNAGACFTVGFFGQFGKSTDGGASWTFTTIEANCDLFGVHFISSSTGWAVGSLGRIFKTTNGGTTWAPTGTTVGNGTFRCVDFMNDQEGIAGGDGFTVRTLDGGTTWHDVVGLTGIREDIAVDPAGLVANRVTVTMNSNPTGRTFKVDGATLTGPTTVVWQTSEPHPVDAITPQTVNANEQFLFDSWSDNGGASHLVSRATTAPFTLTVNYTRQFRLTMASAGNGTVSPGSGFRDAGSVVGINATPNTGFQFDRWTGVGAGSNSGTTAGVNITMNAPITQTASFVGAPFNVTVRTSPTGRSFIVDGTTFTTTQTFSWTTGTTHTLSTAATQGAGAGTRYAFTNWSDGGARSHTVTANPSVTNYTANFQLQYELTMTSPTTRYTPLPGDGWHDAGSTVSIDADFNATGFPITYLTGWAGTGSGSYTGLLQQTDIVMNGPIDQAITTGPFPNRLVWIGTSPTSRSYRVGSTSYTGWNAFRFLLFGPAVALSTDSLQGQTATSRFRFLDWSDAGADTHSVAVGTAPDTILARFRSQLLLTMNGTGGTLSPGTGFHDVGSGVVIQATPQPNFAFAAWTGTGVGSVSGGQNPALVTMNSPITETATFVGLPVSITLRTLPGGVPLLLNGNQVATPFTFAPPAGTAFSIAAVSPFELSPEKRFVFDNWSDGGAPSHTVTPVVPTTYTANGHLQYNVITQVAAGGGGSVSPGRFVDDGDTITIVARPDPGRTFVRWSGTAYTGTQNPVTLTVSGNSVTETATFSANVGVGDAEPLAFALAAAAPNPVHAGGATLSFTVPAAGYARLDVLDLAGRRVATPSAGPLEAGRYSAHWNAVDGSGRPLGAGVYYLRLAWNGRTLTRRMVVAR